MEPKEKVGKVMNLMKQSRLFWSIRKEVIQNLSKAKKDGWKPTPDQIIKAMSSQGYLDQLANMIINCANRTAKRIPLEKDTIPQIQAAKLKWCENIIRAFRTVTSKLRKQDEDDEEDQSVNYVYDSDSLLQFLITIKAKQGARVRQLEAFLFPYELFRIPKYGEIKARFDFMTHVQVITGKDRQSSNYRQRQRKANKLLESELMESDIERFFLYGSTNGQRVPLYDKYFQIEQDQRLISSLLQEIEKKTNPLDSIVAADITDILNDERYFVFKEEIRKLIRMFVRDRTIQDKLKIRPHLFTGLEVQVAKQEIPFSQILPCKMLSRYLAPFCYVSLRIESIYAIFRQFYCNYFCLLHSVSSQPSSILYLALLFEQLLESTEKKLSAHFAALAIQPLRLVFPWMFYCFIGYVDIEQIFYIFDRIIATKSLQILPLYAVSLLFKEKSAILEAKSQEQIKENLLESMKLDNMAETIKYFLTYHL